VADGVDLETVREAVESLAAQLAAKVDALKQADRLRRDLYANVSHDLRTPLTAMRGYLDTLVHESRPLPADRQRAYIGIALKHCERLGRLVDQVFSLARLDATSVRLRPEPVAVTELAQDVVAKFQGLADRGGVRLQLEVDPRAGPVTADIGLLEAVFQNLLDNALRHTSAGGEIVVSVNCEGARCRVAVRDSGCGIPTADLERMQQPFEVGVGGHTGLGLTIVNRVLALHGSHLQLTSAPGIGTTAEFTLVAGACIVVNEDDALGARREEVVMS
jgi:signal transduction histidine kinase